MSSEASNEDRYRAAVDSQFDSAFARIESLSWLPWVGKTYATLPTVERLWIVGESHYVWSDESKEETEEVAKRFLSRREFTRYVAWDWGIGKRNSAARMPRAFEKALLGYSAGEPSIHFIWQVIAFSNRVQRPLDSIRHRPDEKRYQDYTLAWNTFFPVLEVLKPGYCLFVGVEIAEYRAAFEKAAQANGFQIVRPITSFAKIGNTKPRVAEVISADGLKTKLVFIKHSAQPFSWKKWSVFLRQEMGDYVDWLRFKLRPVVG